jgi:nicotinamide-nucleotide amidase
MKAEIIAVSDDLLTGKAHDQNIAFLAKELSSLGVKIHRSHLIEDAKETLRATLEQIEATTDLVVLTGGLGPDENDITKQTIAEYVDIPLVLDQISEEKIITYHKNSSLRMPDNNQLQALVIQDSTPIRNATGLATGMFFEYEQTTYILLPGPFDELAPTYTESVRPLILENLFADMKFATRTLCLFGLSEAELNEKIAPFTQATETSFVGVYPKGEEFEVQITARAATDKEATQEAEALKEEILEQVDEYVFAEKSQSLLSNVKELLSERGLTITAAESLTGGQFLSAFASEMEASAVLPGGIVTYSTEVKNEVLGVSKAITDEFGVVSAQCALEMAEKAKEMFQADVAVSLTGVAGPSSLEGELPGTVWIGVAGATEKAFAKKYHFAYKRNQNRHLAVLTAMNLVRLALLEQSIPDIVFMDDELREDESGEERQ